MLFAKKRKKRRAQKYRIIGSNPGYLGNANLFDAFLIIFYPLVINSIHEYSCLTRHYPAHSHVSPSLVVLSPGVVGIAVTYRALVEITAGRGVSA